MGGNQPIKVNIRLLATSNRDLMQAVKEGSFREDLYFRLNVINVHLPPLRERPQDVHVLAEHFIKKYADVNKVPARPLSPEALATIQSHPWQGNVRELENTMHRAVLLAQGDTISVEDIFMGQPQQPNTDEPTGAALVGKTMAEVEKDLILNTLDHCLGNRTHAANILGISIRTLRNKLKQYSENGESIPNVSADNYQAAI